MAGCGRKTARHDAGPTPRDALQPGTECVTLFDRFRDSLAAELAQIGLDEQPDAARRRDARGIARCSELPETARACLLAQKVGAGAWSACGVSPPFTLFDPTVAHEALLGAAVAPADAATRVAALAGTWVQAPATPLDDTVTWTISADGTLAVRRTNPSAKTPIDEPVRQLSFRRERLLAVTMGQATQFVPLVRVGNALYLSWTSGALAIPVPTPDHVGLDLADHGRWAIWNAPQCAVIDPARGRALASCAWEQHGEARSFVVTHDGVTQRWALRDSMLLHPKLEQMTRR